MRVLIVGCGRVGAAVATALARAGHSVAVVDRESDAFERLGPHFTGDRFTGTGIDREVLLRAGVERADALAALTADDNANIITARVAHNVYRVPTVVARMHDPRRAEIYQRLGIVTVCATNWSARRVSQLLAHRDLDVVLSIDGGQISLIELEAPSAWTGHTVHSVSAPGELLVVAITRAGTAIIPSGGTLLQAGDRVVVATIPGSQRRLERLLAEG